MSRERWIWLGACVLVACGTPETAESPSGADTTGEEREVATTAAVFAMGGFSTPESVLHDPDEDHYLVANIEGSPVERDENGFISKVSPDGEMIEAHFIRGGNSGHGLSAPKGMAISGELLYVADIDRVFAFHRKTGALASETVIPGSTFLNGVAVGSEGEIYVSDSGLLLGEEGFSASGTDAIYVLREGLEPEVVVKDPSLGRPNGVLATEEGLWVVTFGTGELYRVDREGMVRDRRTLPEGTLDGIVALGDGRVAISSWEGESVFVGEPRGELTRTITGVNSPAAIGWDGTRGRVIVPLFMQNEIKAFVLPSPPREAGAP
jgi:sugar lactone lactonase YvrE